MNIKKQLKAERRKIDEQILAEGQDLRQKLIDQYCVAKTEQKQPRKTSFTKWVVAVSCVVVCLIIGLSVGLINTPVIVSSGKCLIVGLNVGLVQPNESEPPLYFEQNQLRKNSSIEEFNKDTNSSIIFGEDYGINVIKIYDSVSNDELYYLNEFEHNDELIFGEIIVVINSNYSFLERHVGEVKKGTFKDCDMEYSVRETSFEDLPINEYFGRITYNDYTIYFSLTELRDSGTQDNSIVSPTVLEEVLILK